MAAARTLRSRRKAIPVLVAAGCQGIHTPAEATPAPDHHHRRLHSTAPPLPPPFFLRPEPRHRSLIIACSNSTSSSGRPISSDKDFHPWRVCPLLPPPPTSGGQLDTTKILPPLPITHTTPQLVRCGPNHSPPFFHSGLVIDHRLPHNTPQTPPKCLPQSSSVAASPSPRG